MSSKTKRKPALILTLGTAIAFIAGGGMAYWWLSNREPSIPESLPNGLDLVPPTAVMTLSVSTDEDQWRQIRSFGTEQTQLMLDQQLAQWRDRLLTANEFDYQQDIASWVGDTVTIALLPGSGNTSPNEGSEDMTPGAIAPTVADQPTLVILPIENPLQAQQQLADAPLLNQVEGTERDYNGVTLRDFQLEDGQAYSGAVINNQFLLMGTPPTALEQAIDTYNGETSVMDTEGYRQAVADVASDRPFLQMFVNRNGSPGLDVPDTGDQALAPTGSLVEGLQGIAATFTPDEQGLQVRLVTWSAEDRQSTSEGSVSRLPDLLPEDTLILLSTSSFNSFWQTYEQMFSGNPDSVLYPDNLSEGILAQTGVDVDQDLQPLLNQEFAIALLPGTNPAANNQGFGLVLLADVSDRARAETLLTQLDDTMESRHRYQVEEIDINGQPVVTWTSSLDGLPAMRGWVGDRTAFLNLGAPVAEVLLDPSDSSLTSNEQFSLALQSAQTDGNTLFFLNFQQLFQANAEGLAFPLPPTVIAFADAIQSIGLSSKVLDSRSTRHDIYLVLSSTRNPGALPPPNADPFPSMDQPDDLSDPQFDGE